jgi:hypothetical protein
MKLKEVSKKAERIKLSRRNETSLKRDRQGDFKLSKSWLSPEGSTALKLARGSANRVSTQSC